MFKESIRRLSPGSALTGLRNLGLRPCIKISRDLYQSPVQATISQIGASELAVGPIPRCCCVARNYGRHRKFTKPFSRPRLQRIHEYPFDGRSTAVRSVAPSTSLRLSPLHPIGGPVTGPFKSPALDECLCQQRLVAVAPSPILA